MHSIRQIMIIAKVNFRRWRRNPQIVLTFGLGFVACFLLSDKVVRFSTEHDVTMQILEPFIWTFGDATSILLISLCLLLLFADMPNVENEIPFLLIRTCRIRFLAGQIIYLIVSTMLFLLFILVSACVLAGGRSYMANLWSDTAAILGYSDIGESIAVPAYVKVLELTYPYQSTLHIFGLMLGYSLFMSSFILYFNLRKNNLGMIAGVIFSGFGIVLTPDMISKWFHISVERIRIANILFGWISPLNHATYYMHNFGYDNLPRLWQSYLFFGVGSMVMFVGSFIEIRKYSFCFTGTER